MSILSKAHVQVQNHLNLQTQNVFMWITVKRQR